MPLALFRDEVELVADATVNMGGRVGKIVGFSVVGESGLVRVQFEDTGIVEEIAPADAGVEVRRR